MEKLISMTDFVLEQGITETLDASQIMWYDAEVTKIERIRSYANFLKQTLTLRMFVPCDADGNVLEEPNTKNHLHGQDSFVFHRLQNQHQEAKDRVLFEGFESIDTRTNGKRVCFKLYGKYRTTSLDQIDSDQYGLFFYNSRMNKARIHKIEDLLKFNKLVLTESAKKQIGIS